MKIKVWDQAGELLTFQHFQSTLINRCKALNISTVKTYQIFLNNALN